MEAEREGDSSALDAAASATESESASSAFTVVDRSKEADADFVAVADVESVEATPKRRGRPAGSTRVPKANPTDVAQAAPLLLGIANQAVVVWMGDNCGMLDTERKFLEPSIARMLARMPKAAAQQVSTYTDPFVVLMAMGLWARRIQKIKEFEAQQRYQIKPEETRRAYGESGTEYAASAEPDLPNMGDMPIAAPPVTSPNGTTDAIFTGRSPL